MTTEIWKDVPNSNGFYQVSNLGQVRSTDRIVKCSRGYESKYFGKILSPSLARGYKFVVINACGRRKQIKVHRLVALAFVENPENKPTVNHKNGIKTDNRVENLEWMTFAENSRHSNNTLFCHQGERNGRSKLKFDDITQIKQLLKTTTVANIAKMYGVSRMIIYRIKKGQSWRHHNA